MGYMGERGLISGACRWATIALAAMPLLGMRPMVLVIALWLVLAIIVRFTTGPAIEVDRQALLVLCAPFLLMLVDLTRAEDIVEGWRSAERSAALVIFPIGFLLLGAPAGADVGRRMIDLFTFTAVALSLFVNFAVFANDANYVLGDPFSASYREAFAAISGVHPPYAAYWFFGAALFQLSVILDGRSDPASRRWLLGRSAVGILLVLAGLLIGSRMPVIAFGIAAAALLFMVRQRTVAFRWIIGVWGALALAALLLPGIRERVGELTGSNEVNAPSTAMNSVEIRGPVLDCTFGILEEHWLLGLGGAKVQPAMDRCYTETGFNGMVANGYGPHDQALYWWLAYGILGLAAFALLFGWSMRRALQRNDAMHFTFLLFMLLCCFTEDLLTRQWGVVFFACFNTLFIASTSVTFLSGVKPTKVS